MQRFLWTNCWKPYHCSCDGNIGHGQHDTPQRFPDDLQEQRTALNLVSGKLWAGTSAFSLIQKVLRGVKMALFIMHGRYFQGICYSWIPLCHLWRGWWKGFPLLEIFPPFSWQQDVQSTLLKLFTLCAKDTTCFQRVTAGSPMVGTPIILVRRPISLGLIKDLCNQAIIVRRLLKWWKSRIERLHDCIGL